MDNYHHLSKLYQKDIEFLRNHFNELISKMISFETDLHHYFETVTEDFLSLGNDLEFNRDINSTKYTVDHVNLFVCKAYKIGGLHIDSAGDPRFVSINLPIMDNDRSQIVWVNPGQYNLGEYDLRDRTIRAGHPVSGALSIGEWEIIDKANFGVPTIIRVNHWHSIDNRFNPQPRVALAIRLAKNPSFEEVVSELRQKQLIGGG